MQLQNLSSKKVKKADKKAEKPKKLKKSRNSKKAEIIFEIRPPDTSKTCFLHIS